jgi:1-deoxy-D-xylulose-5-phosphate reductoisomerase
MPTVLNAANEIAVAAFLEGRIRFVDIPLVIEAMLDKCEPVQSPSEDAIIQVDATTRALAHSFIVQFTGSLPPSPG